MSDNKEQWAVFLEAGEGCDYSIGCGYRLEVLFATNHEDAIKEARSLIVSEPDWEDREDGQPGFHGERTILEARLVLLMGEPLPLAEWYAEYEAKVKQLKDGEREAAEKAELARLQAKYKK